jgi:hypothetical protein
MDLFDFQWETKQQERMQSLVDEVNRLTKLTKVPTTKEAPTNELDRLRFEVSELKLLVAVLVRILEAKDLTTPTDFIEKTEQVAAELRPKAPKAN